MGGDLGPQELDGLPITVSKRYEGSGKRSCKSSAISGLHRMPYEERRNKIQEFTELSDEDMDTLSKPYPGNYLLSLGENVTGRYELPIRFAPNFKINGRDKLIPLITEEASVVAGIASAAKKAYRCGGIEAEVSDEYPRAIGQILVSTRGNGALDEITKRKGEFLALANRGHRYSNAYDIDIKSLPNGKLVVNLYINPGDAMGAAVASDMARAVSKEIEKQGFECNGNIISNASGRLTKARLRIDIPSLERRSKIDGTLYTGEYLAKRIVDLYEFADMDPQRAATHNKGLMNGTDALALATAQDTRAINAACHSYAVRDGTYKPLSSWKIYDGHLEGETELVLPVCTVGSEIKKYPKAAVMLKSLGIENADDLAMDLAAVGLTQNYAALSMLASIGLKEGHGRHR